MIIADHKKYWPAFDLPGHQDQWPLCVYTLLCVGRSGRDCAAYRGIGPDTSMHSEAARESLFAKIRSGGQKIPESEAREMFDLTLNGVNLEYRR